MDRKQKIEEIKKYGKSGRGRAEYLDILSGKHVSYKGKCLAMCYECMGYYSDGKYSCENDICPLYGIMPFKKDLPSESKK